MQGERLLRRNQKVDVVEVVNFGWVHLWVGSSLEHALASERVGDHKIAQTALNCVSPNRTAFKDDTGELFREEMIPVLVSHVLRQDERAMGQPVLDGDSQGVGHREGEIKQLYEAQQAFERCLRLLREPQRVLSGT